MKKELAKRVLEAVKNNNTDLLSELGVSVYGNKGRFWSTTACITSLDSIKGKCNPRLASNYCSVDDIGCPDCLETLEQLANG
jgi:hypothetical protein